MDVHMDKWTGHAGHPGQAWSGGVWDMSVGYMESSDGTVDSHVQFHLSRGTPHWILIANLEITWELEQVGQSQMDTGS